MATLLFVIPILLFFIFAKKREPNQKEFGFWLLFLVPFGIMFAMWFEGENIFKLWWIYLLVWILAGGVLLEKRQKK